MPHGNGPCPKRRQQHRDAQARRRAIRAELIDLLGGECCACGSHAGDYHGLHVHHMGEKNFSFNSSNLAYSQITEELFAELAQCVVLCMKCHQELHANFTRNDPTP